LALRHDRAEHFIEHTRLLLAHRVISLRCGI
jgi:hypothetical protein